MPNKVSHKYISKEFPFELEGTVGDHLYNFKCDDSSYTVKIGLDKVSPLDELKESDYWFYQELSELPTSEYSLKQMKFFVDEAYTKFLETQ